MTILAAVQMVSTADVTANLGAAARLVEQAAAAGATFVSLPEYFCQIGLGDADRLRIAEPHGDGPIQQFLADTARRHGIWLLGGTVPICTASGMRVRNASCLFIRSTFAIARASSSLPAVTMSCVKNIPW